MKIADSTILRVQVGLAVATLCGVAALAWHASALSTKLDVLWADYLTRHSVASSITHHQEAP